MSADLMTKLSRAISTSVGVYPGSLGSRSLCYPVVFPIEQT